MTKIDSINWSIKKWEWLAKSSDPMLSELRNTKNAMIAIPRLKSFLHGCALCSFYKRNDKCPNCILTQKGQWCGDKKSYYYKWAEKSTIDNAKNMLEFLKGLRSQK